MRRVGRMRRRWRSAGPINRGWARSTCTTACARLGIATPTARRLSRRWPRTRGRRATAWTRWRFTSRGHRLRGGQRAGAGGRAFGQRRERAQPALSLRARPSIGVSICAWMWFFSGSAYTRRSSLFVAVCARWGQHWGQRTPVSSSMPGAKLEAGHVHWHVPKSSWARFRSTGAGDASQPCLCGSQHAAPDHLETPIAFALVQLKYEDFLPMRKPRAKDPTGTSVLACLPPTTILYILDQVLFAVGPPGWHSTIYCLASSKRIKNAPQKMA